MPPCSLVAWRWRCVYVVFRRGRLTSLSHAKMAVVCPFPNMVMLAAVWSFPNKEKAWQADTTVACQDGCRRLPFSKYGNAGCRVIGIGCMSKIAAAWSFPNKEMLYVRWLLLAGWCMMWGGVLAEENSNGGQDYHIRNGMQLARWRTAYNSKNWLGLNQQWARTVPYLSCKV